MKHELEGGTLYVEDKGIVGRCVCGWSTGHRISSFVASMCLEELNDEWMPWESCESPPGDRAQSPTPSTE